MTSKNSFFENLLAKITTRKRQINEVYGKAVSVYNEINSLIGRNQAVYTGYTTASSEVKGKYTEFLALERQAIELSKTLTTLDWFLFSDDLRYSLKVISHFSNELKQIMNNPLCMEL